MSNYQLVIAIIVVLYAVSVSIAYLLYGIATANLTTLIWILIMQLFQLCPLNNDKFIDWMSKKTFKD